jgi:hypothetical protein
MPQGSGRRRLGAVVSGIGSGPLMSWRLGSWLVATAAPSIAKSNASGPVLRTTYAKTNILSPLTTEDPGQYHLPPDPGIISGFPNCR